MKQVIESAKKFNSEFKKSVNTAIVGAFGLLIALAWKDVITEYMTKIAGFSPVQGKVVSALIITLVSVAGIMLVTKLVQEKEPEKKESSK